MNGVASLFRCPRPADFAIHIWADGAAVYDDATGDVRALTLAAGEVFSLLVSQPPMSPAALAECLLGELPTEEDLGQMLTLLNEFEFMGIVERVLE